MVQSIANQTIIIKNILNLASHDIQELNGQTQSRLEERYNLQIKNSRAP